MVQLLRDVPVRLMRPCTLHIVLVWRVKLGRPVMARQCILRWRLPRWLLSSLMAYM